MSFQSRNVLRALLNRGFYAPGDNGIRTKESVAVTPQGGQAKTQAACLAYQVRR